MNIEKLTTPPKASINQEYREAFSALKEGECVRVTTPAAYRHMQSVCVTVGKNRGIKFSTRNDGNDVLFFIKP